MSTAAHLTKNRWFPALLGFGSLLALIAVVELLIRVGAINRFIVVHCLFYCELAHERIHRVRAFFDLYDAAVQLGVLPARGTLGEKALLVLRGFGLRSGRG